MYRTVLLIAMVLVFTACSGGAIDGAPVIQETTTTTEVAEVGERSPLYYEAMNIEDIRVGTTVCSYNLEYGLVDYKSGEIVSQPYEVEFSDGSIALAIDIRASDGNVSRVFLADAGIVPYRGVGWNRVNFTTLRVNTPVADGYECAPMSTLLVCYCPCA